jgi:hypothetical protein
MVAGVLHHLGVDMGPSLPPDEANPLGYFEDVRFRVLHQSWSRRYETTYDRARLKMPPWNPAPNATDLGRYARLIRACEQRPLWGVKDPELCYYARHFVAALAHPVQVIATTRNLGAAAASLGAMRRWFSPADCTRIAAEYARRQALTLQELTFRGVPPALTINYDDALADPEGTTRRIADHIELPVTAAATAFITPGLRRHRPPAGDTPRNDQGVTTLTM